MAKEEKEEEKDRECPLYTTSECYRVLECRPPKGYYCPCKSERYY